MSTPRPFVPESKENRHLPSNVRRSLGGDRRDGEIYVYHDPNIALAVNVALATRRPVLISGPSGSGKSCLALNVALILGYRYYEYVVTARTEAMDLLYTFDMVRRLSDAQAREINLKPNQAYIEPGVLWWAINPHSARQRGKDGILEQNNLAFDLKIVDGANGTVVLIDEIDKAEPDVPNNLLVPLGSLQFTVGPTNFQVKSEESFPPLVFITNNNERDLPVAFIRRCVCLTLPGPNRKMLIQIAKAQIPKEKWKGKEGLLDEIAGQVEDMARSAAIQGHQRWSTAEYLDTVQACLDYNIPVDSEEYKYLKQLTLEKQIQLEIKPS